MKTILHPNNIMINLFNKKFEEGDEELNERDRNHQTIAVDVSINISLTYSNKSTKRTYIYHTKKNQMNAMI